MLGSELTCVITYDRSFALDDLFFASHVYSFPLCLIG